MVNALLFRNMGNFHCESSPSNRKSNAFDEREREADDSKSFYYDLQCRITPGHADGDAEGALVNCFRNLREVFRSRCSPLYALTTSITCSRCSLSFSLWLQMSCAA